MKAIIFITLVLLLSVVGWAETIRMYHIGNSLTDDTRPRSQADILRREGYTVEQGYHLACGKSAAYIEANPNDTCINPLNPYGRWLNALTNYEWDVITIQTYTGGTGNAEVQATASIIETALSGGRNQDCVFFLYMAWPGQSSQTTFADQLEKPYTSGSSATVISKDFLDFWYNEVTALFPDLDIRVIPTGIIFSMIDDKLREVQIGSYENAYDLYRDSLHMSNTDGRYVATASMLSAVTRVPPQDHLFSSGDLSPLNPVFRTLVNEVIWYALTVDERTQIEYTPYLNLVQQTTHPYYEFTYLGELYQSTDLNEWEKVTGAASPQRIISDPGHVYYRSVREGSGD